MKSTTARRIFWTACTILILAVIFWFSAQDGMRSTAQSGFFRKLLFFWLDEETGSFLTRKLAHFTIYLLLGISMENMTESWSGKHDAKVRILSWILVILAAAGDEFHQTFISERSGQLFDILLDSLGGLAGIGIDGIWKKIGRRRKESV